MNTDFPRIITLLRKEKGMSQKQVAAELGISQALLSHYEKGIRECGLDFLVRVAKYYDVSCDYLVGITSDRKGAVLNIESTENHSNEKPQCDSHCANLANLNRKLVMNSVYVIFNILAQTGNKNLTSEVSSYLMVSVYKMFRLLYNANPQNPQDFFAINTELQRGLSSALMLVNEANAEVSAKTFIKNIYKDREISLSPSVIQERYPQYAAALSDLIKIAENNMTNYYL
ncbi:MAG: helix-turn-helix transcriptional regulator [Candidatus Pseudoruminococcus sp.]|uniref:helix-turn-helix domain-containing protein n=1 Tax=Candidatus Pseudoruminococcus sp. TaxID=3101048 RepID=UPI002A7AF1F0|nr:helix-turn-helix transcriptional regulator [Ruminococcus sp.]MDY2781779.1 helix-turn-helix transcriptional regulator [Candidatus Pseudoruminococcus sp.]